MAINRSMKGVSTPPNLFGLFSKSRHPAIKMGGDKIKAITAIQNKFSVRVSGAIIMLNTIAKEVSEVNPPRAIHNRETKI